MIKIGIEIIRKNLNIIYSHQKSFQYLMASQCLVNFISRELLGNSKWSFQYFVTHEGKVSERFRHKSLFGKVIAESLQCEQNINHFACLCEFLHVFTLYKSARNTFRENV